MAEPASATDVARKLADALEQSGLSYAVGGAIALGFYAPPRGTVDVDLNVFVPPDRELDRLLAILVQAGFVPADTPDRLRERANDEGQFRGTADGLRVDVFVPSIPFYAQLEDRRRQVELIDRPIWILGAEDLTILKLIFFRPKDLVDIEAMMRDQGAAFDRSYVRRTIVGFVGENDERVAAFDEIESDIAEDAASGDDA